MCFPVSKGRGDIKDDADNAPAKEVPLRKLDKHEIDMINEDWEDSDESSMMWEIISKGLFPEFMSLVQDAPEIIHIRSADGRGPMWWAHEYKRPKMIEIMKTLGVSEERKDKHGKRPLDL